MFQVFEQYKTKFIDSLLDRVPGKQRFGNYRFLPLFFILGASLEFLMIKWTVGETNFCIYIYMIISLELFSIN